MNNQLLARALLEEDTQADGMAPTQNNTGMRVYEKPFIGSGNKR